MSHHNDTWLSKDDVLKDLGDVTGNIVDVSEDFIVRGERPPPPRREDIDISPNFSAPASDYVVEGPDLNGIRSMLRMVSQYEDSAEEPETAPSEVVTISKLNPNVPEFVPIRTITSSPRNKKCNVDTNVSKDSNVVTSISMNSHIVTDLSQNNKTDVCNDKQDCNDIDIEKRIDVAKLKPEEINNITTKLKSQISQAPNTGNLQNKRKRNVAIATLLKLYSANSATQSPTLKSSCSNIVLYPPQYFESSMANATIENDTSVTPKGDETVASGNETSIPLIDTEIKNRVTSSLSPKEKVICKDPEIQQSIEKVTNWLEKPESPKIPKPKGPVLCLDAFSYKRKDNVKSPRKDDSKRSTPTSISAKPTVTHYKPSKYAEDLTKMYEERNKGTERCDQDIWTKVELEMKAKEEKMKKKLEKEKEQSSSSTSPTNSHNSKRIKS